jgi:membrane associated rhomboid family serine protease
MPRRPGVGRWLWYAVTGRLAPRYHAWAFRDLTCRTWPIRHLARLLVLAVPVAALLIVVLPGAMSIRVTAAVTGMVIGVLYSFVFLHDSTDRRAVKLGYTSGAAEAARQRRDTPSDGSIPEQRDHSRS